MHIWLEVKFGWKIMLIDIRFALIYKSRINLNFLNGICYSLSQFFCRSCSDRVNDKWTGNKVSGGWKGNLFSEFVLKVPHKFIGREKPRFLSLSLAFKGEVCMNNTSQIMSGPGFLRRRFPKALFQSWLQKFLLSDYCPHYLEGLLPSNLNDTSMTEVYHFSCCP